jgi:hypothetical protein
VTVPRALALLTVDMLRRLLREGVVLRSLVFPVGLAATAMILTVVAVVLLRPPGTLALTPEAATPAILAEAEAGGWPVVQVDDPHALVIAGSAAAATDGRTIWTYKASAEALRLESLLRRNLNAGWRIEPPTKQGRTNRARSERGTRHLLQFIGALFAFYGVVFGAGSVARDRDEGTFDAELVTALPMWVHGAARWLAGSVLLSAFFAFSVILFDAFIGVAAPVSLAVHGAAACAGSTAIGLVVIGRAGLENGFAAPMSAGLVIVVTLLSIGLKLDLQVAWLPVASLLTDDISGAAALATSVTWGVAGTALFTWRSTVT